MSKRFMSLLMVVAAISGACGAGAATERTDGTVSCIPVPRFRIDGIDYEVQTFEDVVAADDVGALVAQNLVQPDEIEGCVPGFELSDGETSVAAVTEVYSIRGVDPTEALTATGATAGFLRFTASP